MKRLWIYLFVFIIMFSIVLAVDVSNLEDTAKNLEGTVDEINDATKDPPRVFDSVLKKTKAEERIEKINSYIGPITKTLWGYEFTLSWTFFFAFFIWILLIELIVVPISKVFEFNVFGSLATSFIIATLAMQGFGKDLVSFLDSLAKLWYHSLIIIALMFIFGIIYQVIMHFFAKRVKAVKIADEKEKLRRDMQIIHMDAEMSKKVLED